MEYLWYIIFIVQPYKPVKIDALHLLKVMIKLHKSHQHYNKLDYHLNETIIGIS